MGPVAEPAPVQSTPVGHAACVFVPVPPVPAGEQLGGVPVCPDGHVPVPPVPSGVQFGGVPVCPVGQEPVPPPDGVPVMITDEFVIVVFVVVVLVIVPCTG